MLEIMGLNKDRITSLELLDQINIFRKQEGNRAELQHYDLLKIIRDEFEEEINEGKISVVDYKDKKGELRPMYILTYNQAKQILVRESKFVRRAVIHYVERLEEELSKILEKGMIDMIILEDIYLGLNSNVLTMLSEIRGMLTYHIKRLNLELLLVPAVFWKNRVGEVPIHREEQKKYMMERFKELTGVEADSDDAADAYMMLWACLHKEEVKETLWNSEEM